MCMMPIIDYTELCNLLMYRIHYYWQAVKYSDLSQCVHVHHFGDNLKVIFNILDTNSIYQSLRTYFIQIINEPHTFIAGEKVPFPDDIIVRGQFRDVLLEDDTIDIDNNLSHSASV